MDLEYLLQIYSVSFWVFSYLFHCFVFVAMVVVVILKQLKYVEKVIAMVLQRYYGSLCFFL